MLLLKKIPYFGAMFCSKLSKKQKVSSFSRDNNFDFMRLFAAFLVLLSHNYSVLGSPDYLAVASNHTVAFGTIGVAIFFAISGFFITKSYLNTTSLFQYAKKRILRIFPALIVCVFVSVFIFAPIITTSDSYWSSNNTYRYLFNSVLFTKYRSLEGVWDNNPIPSAGSFNNSIWTLPVEASLYIFVSVIGVMGVFKARASYVFVIISVLFLYLQIVSPHKLIWNDTIHLAEAFRYGLIFLIGGGLYLFKDKIPINKIGALAVAAIYIMSIRTSLHIYATLIAVPYLVIYIGFLKNKIFNNWGKYGDFSYGLYIYGFPVQQFYVRFYPEINFWVLLISSLATALFLAFISWHLVEKRALIFAHKK